MKWYQKGKYYWAAVIASLVIAAIIFFVWYLPWVKTI